MTENDPCPPMPTDRMMHSNPLRGFAPAALAVVPSEPLSLPPSFICSALSLLAFRLFLSFPRIFSSVSPYISLM